MKVFVLDSDKKPLAPTSPARARQLLSNGKAAVYRRFPFTIILKRSIIESEIDSTERRIKIDPGSKVTGIVILNQKTGQVEFAAELTHRGHQIKSDLDSRRSVRRSRRNRKTRYHKPRFLNRKKQPGWLPPSLMSRVYNIKTWIDRLRKLCPIQTISLELVRFDTQKLQNPEISGIEYQQGELLGYEVREYLLEKWSRECAYCHAKNIPLEVEHIVPKSRGGTNRISNLTLACNSCNQKKGNQTAEEFGRPHIQSLAKKPLKDAAAVNATRWRVFHELKSTGFPIECGTGGRTKYNRIQQDLPKSHWIDAACVGAFTPGKLRIDNIIPLQIKATGYGSRQMCLMNKYGFPRTKPKLRTKKSFGFQTGDIVKAMITRGRNIGIHIGKITIRHSPSFHLNDINVHPKYLILLHHSDGYTYLNMDKVYQHGEP